MQVSDCKVRRLVSVAQDSQAEEDLRLVSPRASLLEVSLRRQASPRLEVLLPVLRPLPVAVAFLRGN